jgi:hypothetical protein
MAKVYYLGTIEEQRLDTLRVVIQRAYRQAKARHAVCMKRGWSNVPGTEKDAVIEAYSDACLIVWDWNELFSKKSRYHIERED